MTISSADKTESVECGSPQETEEVGRRLATRLRPGDVLAVSGELGAGKTVLIRAVARARGFAGPVTSPTFTIIHEYPTWPPLYHIDLYRLRSEREARDIGIEEYLGGNGICLVEWAERIEALLPPHTLRVRIEILSEQARRVTIQRP